MVFQDFVFSGFFFQDFVFRYFFFRDFIFQDFFFGIIFFRIIFFRIFFFGKTFSWFYFSGLFFSGFRLAPITVAHLLLVIGCIVDVHVRSWLCESIYSLKYFDSSFGTPIRKLDVIRYFSWQVIIIPIIFDSFVWLPISLYNLVTDCWVVVESSRRTT